MSSASFTTWVNASRPKTLAAAFVPVIVGASLAAQHGEFIFFNSSIALLCAFLIQIGTNFANDYFDFVKGADTEDRIGFERATASGKIAPKTMLRATILSMLFAFLLGLYLVWFGGWPVLIIGLLSLLFGVLYTGGPFPLGYNGLGDLFVFIFFGIVAVMTTYYVNTLSWAEASFWASLPVGALCTNILVVNNLRDVKQDRKAGKRTLGVLLGEPALKWEYTLMALLAFVVPIYFLRIYDYSLWILLPLLSLPLALKLTHTIWVETDKVKLNPILEQTAQLMAIFGILFSIGLFLG